MADFTFNFGTEAFSSDGRRVGTVERVIVEEEGFDPQAIVVKEDARFAGKLLAPGALYFQDELVVPLDNVRLATKQKVELSLTARQVRLLRPYLSYRYRPVDSAEVGRAFVALVTGGITPPNVDEIAAKRQDQIEINVGENVMLGDTGKRLGQVREVLVEDGEFIGIVVHPAGLFKHDVVVPVRFLDRSDDLALFLDATEEDIQRLLAVN